MARKPIVRKVIRIQKQRPTRLKLDPRLALLLSLPDKQRRALKAYDVFCESTHNQ